MSRPGSDTNKDRRAAMFDKIRTGISDGGTVSSRRAAVEARLTSQAPHLIPERGKRNAAGRRAMFTDFLRGQTATVLPVASDAEVPAVIAAYLRNTNRPMRLRMGDDPRLAALPWSKEPTLTQDTGAAQPADQVGLTHAVAGIAETGTLLMTSGASNPVTVNFLPETHVVVIRAKDIAGNYEAAFEAVRAQLGKGTMPRTLNLISGPSRTADIGGRLVVGAHGPRRLCVVIVGE